MCNNQDIKYTVCMRDNSNDTNNVSLTKSYKS